jgi:hypothetical protein
MAILPSFFFARVLAGNGKLAGNRQRAAACGFAGVKSIQSASFQITGSCRYIRKAPSGSVARALLDVSHMDPRSEAMVCGNLQSSTCLF